MTAWTIAVCTALTAAGLLISWLSWRRSGARRAVRVAAWALLPLAAYLTGAVPLVERIGSAIARFAAAFVFSPRTWAGVALAGLSVLLLLISGVLPMRRKGTGTGKGSRAAGPGGQPGRPAEAGTGKTASLLPGMASSRPSAGTTAGTGQAGGDFGDVEEILRRRGIK